MSGGLSLKLNLEVNLLAKHYQTLNLESELQAKFYKDCQVYRGNKFRKFKDLKFKCK